MIAVALVLSTAPFAGHFWARDLGALARDLAESPDAPQAAFFGELLRLCDCEPLVRAEGIDPLRALLRVEEARRIRLGARAASSRTVWRDVLRPDFFRRDPGNPPEDDALRWPDEEERWTGERLLVAAPRFACGDAAKPEKTRAGTLSPQPARPAGSDQRPADLVAALVAARHFEAASLLAYYEAAALFRAGKIAEAAALSRAIDPAHLGPLSRWGSLLRIATGADDRSAAIALSRDWKEGEGAAAAQVVAVDALARAGKWTEAVAASDGLPAGPRTPLLAHARLLRVRGLFEIGKGAAARDALARDDRGDAARDLAVEVLAAGPVDGRSLEVAGALFPDVSEALLRVARRALLSGSVPVARSALLHLDPAEPRARALSAELAFAANDATEIAPAFANVLSAPLARHVRGSARDRAVVELCHSLVELAPRATPRLRAEAASILLAAREDIGSSAQKAVDAAVAALRTKGAAAIGVVPVGSTLPIPDLPPIQLDWPEPRSLLAIPDEAGGMRDWFPESKTIAGGPAT